MKAYTIEQITLLVFGVGLAWFAFYIKEPTISPLFYIFGVFCLYCFAVRLCNKIKLCYKEKKNEK